MSGELDASVCDALLEAGLIAPIDAAFARLLARLSGLSDDASVGKLLLLASMASRACTAEKAARLDFAALTPERVEGVFRELRTRRPSLVAKTRENVLKLFKLVEPGEWSELLRALPSLAVERGEIDKSPPKPLVYDVAAGCVYLRKQFLAERRVAEGVKARSSKEGVAAPEALAMIAKVFPLYEAPPPGEPDLQKEAALAVASKSFAIVTGGPGTGKTTSVAAALCALLAGNPGLRVGLAAPTGKAASQVLTSIAAQRGLLAKKGVPQSVLDALPKEASTLHKLLEWSPSRERYMRNAANPLPFDALLVDEASMMPLAQADALLSAMQEGGRLILLGDKDQLASVDAGSVFADLCAKSSVVDGSSPFALKDCVVELKKVHRFAEGGSIAALKDAINAQDADGAWRLLSSGAPGLRLVELPEGPSKIQLEILRRELKALFDASAFKGYLKEREPEKAFALFESLRVLCSNRSGPFGVEALNELLLEFAYGRRSFETLAGTRGLPLMILRNSYSTGLNNGDVGLVLPSKSGRGDAVYFRAGGASGEAFRSCPLPLLPERETAFAMSVHKAQGSGFGHAVLVLPPDPSTRLLTKELLYTAATRARSELTVFCSEAAFKAGVLRRTERASGLADALRQA